MEKRKTGNLKIQIKDEDGELGWIYMSEFVEVLLTTLNESLKLK